MGEMVLPLQQQRIYSLLCEHANSVVAYAAFESVVAFTADDRNNLAHSIYRLRKRGLKIENVSGVGYLLRRRKKPAMRMQIVEMTENDEAFASDIQDVISGVMVHYAEEVSLESQIAIMAVAIGAFLHQLPDFEREHYMEVFIKNMKEATNLSTIVHLN